MRLAIHHETLYRYADQVRASIQYLRLTPQGDAHQRILDWELALPRPARAQRDPFGNILHVLTLDTPHDAITITASGQVEIDEDFESEPCQASPFPFLRQTRLTEADAALADFAREVCDGHRDRATLIQLMERLHERMAYIPGSTDVDGNAAQAFAKGAGVCQDHAHAFLACARSLGIPARYVSGYLCTDDSEHLSSHAWAEAWHDGAWYSYDVTNRLARPERHLRLAVGLDYLDACPVRGMRRGGGVEQMEAKVLVEPLQQVQQQQQ
ncbi:transglutaminase [Pseudomonas oryzihabitans]|nr:transglutaminase [Pseudomonas psychrotolerans]KTT49571.1 transglutaminase [Pseudomonas psychrotolerans]